jgi:flagellar basal-body rod protein FlgF
MDLNSTIAASRLIAQQHAMDVTANNLANANTPGFKREQTQFGDWLSRQSGTDVPPGGQIVAYTQDLSTWRDTQQGALSHTGNTYDLALTGAGYFTVNTPRGVRLTRDGRFGAAPDGTLADSSGDAVLDSNGQPLRIPPNTTHLAIAGDGTLSTDAGPIGKVGVVKPNDPAKLQAEGATLLNAPTGTTPVLSPGIVQGALEESNVQPVMELTRMMNDAREFQFVSQYVQAEADRQNTAIDKLLPANG